MLPRGLKEAIEQKTTKNYNWDSPFESNSPALTPAGRKTAASEEIDGGAFYHTLINPAQGQDSLSTLQLKTGDVRDGDTPVFVTHTHSKPFR